MVAVLVKLVMQTHRAPLPLNSVDSEVEAVDAGAVHIVQCVHCAPPPLKSVLTALRYHE